MSKEQGTRIQISNLAATGTPSIPQFDSLDYFIEGFLLKQRSQRHTAETLKYYKQKLGRFSWFITHEGYPTRITEITPNHIRAFLIYLQEQHTARWGSSHQGANRPLSPWALHGFARAVRAFWKWTAREARIPNPFDNVDMPSLPNQWRVETFTDQEIAAIFAACTQTGTEFSVQRNRAIVATLFDSGIRAAELLSLQLSDIDPRQGSFTITGKGGKTRDVAIGSFARNELWVYLRDYRLKVNSNSTSLFVSRSGAPLTYSGLAQIFKKLRKHSGITRVSVRPHLLRHTAATTMFRNGMRGPTLQAQLGHSQFDTTRRFYLDIPRQALTLEHEQFGPLDHLRVEIKAAMPRAAGERELNGRGRWEVKLPEPSELAEEVRQSNYRAVARKYGTTDTTIKNRLRAAGLV